MFNRITGRFTGKSAEGVFIATGGIEWDITMPANDARAIEEAARVIEEAAAAGGASSAGGGAAVAGAAANGCVVYTWLYHREDLMKLFGFCGEQRRALFLELLKVEGIGPKAAVKIMGGITQEELERALETEDLARLEAVPGLGKKTAQKMLLSLKGKIVREGAAGESTPFDDLARALAGMGYERKRAVEALNKAAASPDIPKEGAERENALFRKAIYYLTA